MTHLFMFEFKTKRNKYIVPIIGDIFVHVSPKNKKRYFNINNFHLASAVLLDNYRIIDGNIDMSDFFEIVNENDEFIENVTVDEMINRAKTFFEIDFETNRYFRPKKYF